MLPKVIPGVKVREKALLHHKTFDRQISGAGFDVFSERKPCVLH